MTKTRAVLGSLVFLFVAPGTVAGLIPRWISGWEGRPFPDPLRYVGGVLIVAGAALLLNSFLRFAVQGLGTPAPVLPTKHLVVTGPYRHVRNPMYVAIVAVVLGQSLYFGNLTLLGYAALVWVGFNIFVIAYEEPKLRATFGPEYEKFCAHVGRWIPRLRPWHNP